jgi:hypothetical protein
MTDGGAVDELRVGPAHAHNGSLRGVEVRAQARTITPDDPASTVAVCTGETAPVLFAHPDVEERQTGGAATDRGDALEGKGCGGSLTPPLFLSESLVHPSLD